MGELEDAVRDADGLNTHLVEVIAQAELLAKAGRAGRTILELALNGAVAALAGPGGTAITRGVERIVRGALEKADGGRP